MKKTLVRGAGVIDGTGSGYRSGTALLLERIAWLP